MGNTYAQKKMAQRYAIQKKYEKEILKANPKIDDESGIYFLTRTDENNIGFFYIGQAVKLKSRMVSHMQGYQHIDLSLRKRNFYSEKNPYGWKLNFKHYPKSKLDEMEQYWILEYTKAGYQCRYNKTAGGQGDGKEKINEFKPHKGYRDGLAQGKKSLAKELRDIIDKHLVVTVKPEKAGNKVSEKMLEKFEYLLDEDTYKDD